MRHFLSAVLVLIVCTAFGYGAIAVVSRAAQAFYTGEPVIESVRSLSGSAPSPTPRPKSSPTSTVAAAAQSNTPLATVAVATSVSTTTVQPTPTPLPLTPTIPPPTGTPPPTAVLGVSQQAGTPTSTPAQLGHVGNTGGFGTYLRHSAIVTDHWLRLPDGTPLELLGSEAERDNESWLWVQDPKGNVGWIQARYVVN